MEETRGTRGRDGTKEGHGALPGIVIADGGRGLGGALRAPRIQAFVWGGKVAPSPTLPYGRWKGVA